MRTKQILGCYDCANTVANMSSHFANLTSRYVRKNNVEMEKGHSVNKLCINTLVGSVIGMKIQSFHVK